MALGDAMFFRKKAAKDTENKKQQTRSPEYTLSKSLESNKKLFNEIFKNDDTFVMRFFENQKFTEIKCCILFIDGMVKNEIINDNIIQPVVQNTMLKDSGDVIGTIQNQVLVSNDITRTSDVDKLIKAIITGDTVFLLDGSKEALVIKTFGIQTRSIAEPETEKVITGPREGFIELMTVNLTLIRRRLGTPDLKFKFMTIGVQTQTKVCVCYMDNVVNHKILNELYQRLESIDIDGILATHYIKELIKDSPFSLFQTIGFTERPDVVAANLLEGRIAVLVDGNPTALTLPYTFWEYFQTNDDYYTCFYFASLSRLLRIIGFLITTGAPAIYVSLVSYHQEMIPTPLLLSISSARQGVPFPTVVETILLLFVFELLREAAVRMPSNVSQALSIVGALVLGQASVEAKIVSAPVVIAVGISGITGLLVPKIRGEAVFLRLFFLILSAFLGLHGYVIGVAYVLLHLCEIRSFGVPYTVNLTSFDPQDIKDTVIRAPWWYMKLRPKLIAADNIIRQKTTGRKS